MSDISQNLHRDIMRSVKIVKTRYYLYGVSSGFLIGLLVALYFMFNEMKEQGSLDFFSIWMNSIKIDVAELFGFNQEIIEFFPWKNIIISLLFFSGFVMLSILIIRYRKVLFLKVEKFTNKKY